MFLHKCKASVNLDGKLLTTRFLALDLFRQLFHSVFSLELLKFGTAHLKGVDGPQNGSRLIRLARYSTPQSKRQINPTLSA